MVSSYWLFSLAFFCPYVTGMVPALFADDEKDSILNQIGEEAAKAGVGTAKESIWQYFVSKCASNLHIVLGMSPVGDDLRTWCRNFPGINCILCLVPSSWKTDLQAREKSPVDTERCLADNSKQSRFHDKGFAVHVFFPVNYHISVNNID